MQQTAVETLDCVYFTMQWKHFAAKTAGLSNIKLKVLKWASLQGWGKKNPNLQQTNTGEEYLEEPSRRREEILSQNPTGNMFEKNRLDILNCEKKQ